MSGSEVYDEFDAAIRFGLTGVHVQVEERCVGCGRTPSEGVGCSSCPGYNSQGYPEDRDEEDDDLCEGCGRSRTLDECECESVDVRRNRS